MDNVLLPALQATGTYPAANIRLPLESGDKEKANLLLGGEISRVDPAAAERLTQAIIQKSAETLLNISTDMRRQGLFLLPFRFYTMTMLPDGTLSFPSPQALALPADFPPHPEITAFSATEDALSIAMRIPVRPHRLIVPAPANLPTGHSLRTFISYPLYIPNPKEMRGSIGSVRSAVGGNATGIRFEFLSTSAVKASVAAPEKYYEMVGNVHTGYRISSKKSASPDYACYADKYGYVPPFPRQSLLALGADVDADTDPMDWIADWEDTGDGCLPITLPHKYRNLQSADPYPSGIESEEVSAMAEELGMPCVMLINPMEASEGKGRCCPEPTSIRSLHVHGVPDAPAFAILYGSHDCRHWMPLRRFDPHHPALLLTPKRLRWRLLLFAAKPWSEVNVCIK